MITASYARTMASYNAEMNRRLYDAAARLSDAERRAERGAFWGSIHGTLNHLYWGDGNWMARFAGWDASGKAMKESPLLFEDFDDLRAARVDFDERIIEWMAALDDAWLAQDMSWYSGSLGHELVRGRGFLMAHMFNHQTHHRGQVHAMITAAGQQTGDTDLFAIVEPLS
jgi:uncharacterized damage-inducible protein DinB